MKHLFGTETCVTEIWQASNIWPFQKGGEKFGIARKSSFILCLWVQSIHRQNKTRLSGNAIFFITRMKIMKGQIFNACHISVTPVSIPKRCFNLYWTFFYFLQQSSFLGWDTCHWDITSIKDLVYSQLTIILGQIFIACHISLTHISGISDPKSLAVVENKKNLQLKWKVFLKPRYALLRYAQHKKFHLLSI